MDGKVSAPLVQTAEIRSVCFQLLETKSTDRKQTLLHYISNVVREKYPGVILFYNELHYVDKAAAGESAGQSQRSRARLTHLTRLHLSGLCSEPGERPV